MYAFTCVSILSDFMSGIMHYDHLHMYLFYFIIIGGFNKDYYYYYYYYYYCIFTFYLIIGTLVLSASQILTRNITVHVIEIERKLMGAILIWIVIIYWLY